MLQGGDDERGEYQPIVDKDLLPKNFGRQIFSAGSSHDTVKLLAGTLHQPGNNLCHQGTVMFPALHYCLREKELKAPLTGRARTPPHLLLVVSPNQLDGCAGVYILQANEPANGQPLWKNKRKAFWLFSTPKGRWAIAGKDVRDAGFVRSSGWIYQEQCHEGLMPDQSSSQWQLFDGKGAFTPDEAFKVTAPTGDQEGGSNLQAPDNFCKVLPKSHKQQKSCNPGCVIGALAGVLMGKRSARRLLT